MGSSITQQKEQPLSLKSVNFDHEIMKIGLICSNLIENSNYSSNPGQNPALTREIFEIDHELKFWNSFVVKEVKTPEPMCQIEHNKGNDVIAPSPGTVQDVIHGR
jgi:hypothetical protein